MFSGQLTEPTNQILLLKLHLFIRMKTQPTFRSPCPRAEPYEPNNFTPDSKRTLINNSILVMQKQQ